MVEVLTGNTILLTGGTGTFGNIFAKIAREEHEPTVVRVFSRGELLGMSAEEIQDLVDDQIIDTSPLSV